MRRVVVGALAAVLLTGLAAAAQDSDGDLHSAPPKQLAWWDGWLGAKPKPEPKKADADKPPPTPAADAAATARQRERTTYLRRVAVCDRLMQIAVEKNDADMQQRAEELSSRAWDVYQQRTSSLPGAPNLNADEAQPAPKHYRESASLTGGVKP